MLLRVDRSGGVPLVVMLGVLTMLRRAHAADHWPGDRLVAFEARDAAAGRMGDKSPRWAAIGFACTTGYASAVALRENLPGEPFGLRVPISVRAGILTGWGSSVAAPWPMPVVGLLAVRRSARGAGEETSPPSSAPPSVWRALWASSLSPTPTERETGPGPRAGPFCCMSGHVSPSRWPGCGRRPLGRGPFTARHGRGGAAATWLHSGSLASPELADPTT
jgi:hypothetical protein